VGQHPDEFGPGILLMLLPLHLKYGPNTIQRPVETVLFLKPEIHLPVFHRIQHIGNLPDSLIASSDYGYRRHDNRDDNAKKYDKP
jgi:hypothetical protein